MTGPLSRRALVTGVPGGLLAAALATLGKARATAPTGRAKRVISLFQFGGPSQFELFDPKPKLAELHGTELPRSVRARGPLSGLSADQKSLPLVGSKYAFARHGEAGTPLSELLPHTAKVVDQLCVVRSLATDVVAHDPAILLMQAGGIQAGRPSLGAWVSYGLGSASQDLPTYVVLTSRSRIDDDTQPLASRMWGNGFLPSRHQGIAFRGQGEPILYLSDPPGVSRKVRRAMLDAVRALNRHEAARSRDPETDTRIAQYELAFRMQTSVPQLLDLSSEPASVLAAYGPDVRRPGSYAWNCLMARRLAERGVRFVQLFHRGWDTHGGVPRKLPVLCGETDQPSAALVADLAQRGLLDDTLVFWGGEFGRTAYCQGKLTAETYGRDHHGRCFSGWLAGGGVKAGALVGETDELGVDVVSKPIGVRDLLATVLHLVGLDHERLTFRYQGLDQKLTGVEPARVAAELLAAG